MKGFPVRENGAIIAPRRGPGRAARLRCGTFRTVSGRFTCKQLSHNGRNGPVSWY